jgi:sulfhydrogenase subunit beta (sulfur reductase)
MRFISRQNLLSWLDEISRQSTLIAPRFVEGVLLYRPVTDTKDIVFDYIRPVMSIKEFFFPSTERLITIKKNDQTIKLLENKPEGKIVIFGLRPCDVRGLLVLDSLFLDSEPVDVYYAAHRRNTTLVGVACKQMGETCFCTSMGGTPDDPEGMDIMLTETAKGYLVDVITEKGEELAKSLGTEEKSVEKPLRLSGQDITLPQKESWPKNFESKYWERVSERCLSCRICAYICPTCRCFDIRDEEIPGANGENLTERIRCWDSCAGEVYRRIAGGHNPREAKADRMRNRFMCKFYYYPEQYGPIACTGCGRCIDSCPVNIDITEVLSHLAEVSV